MPTPEQNNEFAQQVLQDIQGDLATISQIVQRLLQATGTGYAQIATPDWRELESLRYAERQLDQKIRYLRGETRY